MITQEGERIEAATEEVITTNKKVARNLDAKAKSMQSTKGNAFSSYLFLNLSYINDSYFIVFRGTGSRKVNKHLSNDNFTAVFDRPYRSDFPLFCSNESFILKNYF